MSSASSISLLALSPELHLSILSHLPLSAKRHLRLVCQLFNSLLILEVPLEELRSESAKKKKSIFLVEGAKRGEVGFNPFIIRAVRVHNDADVESKSNAEGTSTNKQPHISLDIYYPKFMQNNNEDDRTEENEWEIHILMDSLSLSSKTTLSGSPRGSLKASTMTRFVGSSLVPLRVC